MKLPTTLRFFLMLGASLLVLQACANRGIYNPNASGQDADTCLQITNPLGVKLNNTKTLSYRDYYPIVGNTIKRLGQGEWNYTAVPMQGNFQTTSCARPSLSLEVLDTTQTIDADQVLYAGPGTYKSDGTLLAAPLELYDDKLMSMRITYTAKGTDNAEHYYIKKGTGFTMMTTGYGDIGENQSKDYVYTPIIITKTAAVGDVSNTGVKAWIRSAALVACTCDVEPKPACCTDAPLNCALPSNANNPACTGGGGETGAAALCGGSAGLDAQNCIDYCCGTSDGSVAPHPSEDPCSQVDCSAQGGGGDTGGGDTGGGDTGGGDTGGGDTDQCYTVNQPIPASNSPSSDGLNVRSSPSTTAARVGGVRDGVTVKFIEGPTDGWLKIQTLDGSLTGWACDTCTGKDWLTGPSACQ